MTNTLKVIKPFFVMEEGDTFEKTENGSYRSEYSSSYSVAGSDVDADSVYNSSYEISESYAKALLNEGILEEVNPKRDSFVNVFDEIESLLKTYNADLCKLEEDMKDAPACLKVEKETVLRNMSKLLDHLYSLKK